MLQHHQCQAFCQHILATLHVCTVSLQVVMNNQRKIIWPGGETEKPQGFQMSTRLKVGEPCRCDVTSMSTHGQRRTRADVLVLGCVLTFVSQRDVKFIHVHKGFYPFKCVTGPKRNLSSASLSVYFTFMCLSLHAPPPPDVSACPLGFSKYFSSLPLPLSLCAAPQSLWDQTRSSSDSVINSSLSRLL